MFKFFGKEKNIEDMNINYNKLQ